MREVESVRCVAVCEPRGGARVPRGEVECRGEGERRESEGGGWGEGGRVEGREVRGGGGGL